MIFLKKFYFMNKNLLFYTKKKKKTFYCIVDMLLELSCYSLCPGVTSLVSGTLATWYSSLLIASLWKWNGKKHITYRELAGSIFGWYFLISIPLFNVNINIRKETTVSE